MFTTQDDRFHLVAVRTLPHLKKTKVTLTNYGLLFVTSLSEKGIFVGQLWD